jgi:hypothetical protein
VAGVGGVERDRPRSRGAVGRFPSASRPSAREIASSAVTEASAGEVVAPPPAHRAPARSGQPRGTAAARRRAGPEPEPGPAPRRRGRAARSAPRPGARGPDQECLCPGWPGTRRARPGGAPRPGHRRRQRPGLQLGHHQRIGPGLGRGWRLLHARASRRGRGDLPAARPAASRAAVGASGASSRREPAPPPPVHVIPGRREEVRPPTFCGATSARRPAASSVARVGPGPQGPRPVGGGRDRLERGERLGGGGGIPQHRPALGDRAQRFEERRGAARFRSSSTRARWAPAARAWTRRRPGGDRPAPGRPARHGTPGEREQGPADGARGGRDGKSASRVTAPREVAAAAGSASRSAADSKPGRSTSRCSTARRRAPRPGLERVRVGERAWGTAGRRRRQPLGERGKGGNPAALPAA